MSRKGGLHIRQLFLISLELSGTIHIFAFESIKNVMIHEQSVCILFIPLSPKHMPTH